MKWNKEKYFKVLFGQFIIILFCILPQSANADSSLNDGGLTVRLASLLKIN